AALASTSWMRLGVPASSEAATVNPLTADAPHAPRLAASASMRKAAGKDARDDMKKRGTTYRGSGTSPASFHVPCLPPIVARDGVQSQKCPLFARGRPGPHDVDVMGCFGLGVRFPNGVSYLVHRLVEMPEVLTTVHYGASSSRTTELPAASNALTATMCGPAESALESSGVRSASTDSSAVSSRPSAAARGRHCARPSMATSTRVMGPS